MADAMFTGNKSWKKGKAPCKNYNGGDVDADPLQDDRNPAVGSVNSVSLPEAKSQTAEKQYAQWNDDIEKKGVKNTQSVFNAKSHNLQPISIQIFL